MSVLFFPGHQTQQVPAHMEQIRALRQRELLAVIQGAPNGSVDYVLTEKGKGALRGEADDA